MSFGFVLSFWARFASLPLPYRIFFFIGTRTLDVFFFFSPGVGIIILIDGVS